MTKVYAKKRAETVIMEDKSGQRSDANRCKFPGSNCLVTIFKNEFCKGHYLDQLKQKVRRDVKKTFKDPDSAFASFNFFGKKTIKMQDIVSHNIMGRFGYDKEDLQAYLLRDKVFANEQAEIDFTTFKKHFFVVFNKEFF